MRTGLVLLIVAGLGATVLAVASAASAPGTSEESPLFETFDVVKTDTTFEVRLTGYTRDDGIPEWRWEIMVKGASEILASGKTYSKDTAAAAALDWLG